VSDHFLYVACIGPFALTGWVVQRVAGRLPRRVAALTSGTVVVALIALAGLSIAYIPAFADARSFWSRSIERAPDNAVAHLSMGIVLLNDRQLEEALRSFHRAAALQPQLSEASMHAAQIELHFNDLAAAERTLSAALTARPSSAVAVMLATTLARQGRADESVAMFSRASALDPTNADARLALAQGDLAAGRAEEAYQQCMDVIRMRPELGFAYIGAATCLKSQDRWAEGAAMLREGLRHAPDDAPLQNMLALYYAAAPQASVRRGREAVTIASRLRDRMAQAGPAHLQPIDDTLAAAYAEVGMFEQAVQAAERAASLAQQMNNEPARVESLRRAEMYRQRQPWRMSP